MNIYIYIILFIIYCIYYIIYIYVQHGTIKLVTFSTKLSGPDVMECHGSICRVEKNPGFAGLV